MILAQPSPPTSSAPYFPISASTQRSEPSPFRSGRLGVILGLCCAKAQKCLSASPLPATLTHTLSRNPFPCHSYANTRDMGATSLRFFSPTELISRSRPLPYLPLESTLAKVYQNKQLHLPLESTLVKKPGEGGGALLTSHNQFPAQFSQCLSGNSECRLPLPLRR